MQFQSECDLKKYIWQVNHNVSRSWDENVFIRAADLEGNTDYSYINIIKPWIIEKVLSNTNNENRIIDIGCGCGYLANSIYQNDRTNVIGIDISPLSIEYAQQKYPYITFYCQDVCNFVSKQFADMCLAVMMMNYVPDIYKLYNSVRKMLLPNGKLVAVIPHPCFWPNKHINDNNYSYENETAYNYNFATKGRSDYNASVLYFHRKLETYINCAHKNGFILTDFQELTEEQVNESPDILCMEFTVQGKF